MSEGSTVTTADPRSSRAGRGAWRMFVTLQAVVAGILFTSIIVLTFMNVIVRYFLSGSLPWADEVARLTFIVFGFLAAAIAVASRSHLAVDAIVTRLPPRSRSAVDALATLCALGLFGLLMVGGWIQASNNFVQLSPALQLPLGYIYLGIPASAVLMLLNFAGSWWFGPYELPSGGDDITDEDLSFGGGA